MCITLVIHQEPFTKLRLFSNKFPSLSTHIFYVCVRDCSRSRSTLVITDTGNGFRSYELETPRTYHILGVFGSSLGVRLLNVSAASIKRIFISVFSNSKFLLTLFFTLSTIYGVVIIIKIIIIFIIVIYYHLSAWYLQMCT